ncbi:DUF2637 domain-containing protein [Streptomyces albidoflavus]
MTTTVAPKTAHISGWDRAVVIALGGAGCALSYDALQQMAVSIHIRGFLTYLFPLVIDGFIAYGIRALLVLRDAPLRARLYVWTLFGTATVASIWANALHAVRLNEDTVTGPGLRLGDLVVAVLSTVAPLALAGAVHLYILIARGPVKNSDRDDLGQAGHAGLTDRSDGVEVTRADRIGQQPVADRGPAGQPVTARGDRQLPPADKEAPVSRSLPRDREVADSPAPVAGRHGQPPEGADLPGQPNAALPVADLGDRPAPPTGDQDSSAVASAPPATNPVTRSPGGRRADPDTEELLRIARSAVKAEDKLTRKVVATAIRGQKIPLSSDTLTALMAQLREQPRQPVTSART